MPHPAPHVTRGAARPRVVGVERRVEGSRQVGQHRLDLWFDVLPHGRLDAQAVVQQDRADLAPDHVGVVVGETDLLAEGRLGLVAQRRECGHVGVRLFGEAGDREEERRPWHRVGVERQPLELGIESLPGR